jgi:AcrR family transcriptional regulator
MNCMGNREALLLGAKRCLLEKGYARTTARDIAAAADVSLAAIGYHFSSKEALLTEALMLAIADWDLELRRALNTAIRADADPVERFEAIWARLIESFETHRSLWVANFELFAQMDRLPEIRRILRDSLQQARFGLAALFLNKEESAIDKQTARTTGAFYHALLSGLISLFLIDPEHALSAGDLTEALRTTAALMPPGHKASRTKPKHIQKKLKKRQQ